MSIDISKDKDSNLRMYKTAEVCSVIRVSTTKNKSMVVIH